MKKIYRILGQKGRTTIPYAIRKSLGLQPDDVLSFRESKDGTSVIVKREKICDGCQSQTGCVSKPKKGKVRVEKTDDKMTLYDFLNGLSPEQQRAALVHLSVKWAASQGGEKNA